MAREQKLLTPEALSAFLKTHSQWREEKKSLSRTLEFPSFKDGMKFVNRVAEKAEAANHHPDIDIRYNKITLVLSTHDAGGLTGNDTALAEQIDQAAGL